MHPTIWFWLELQLRSSTAGVLSPRELARRTGRSYAAVTRAIREGRIARARAATLPPGRIYVQVSDEEIRAWRRRSIEEVIAADPHHYVQNDVEGWCTVEELIGRWTTSRASVQRRLARIGAPRLEWGQGTPFRSETWYWIPVEYR